MGKNHNVIEPAAIAWKSTDNNADYQATESHSEEIPTARISITMNNSAPGYEEYPHHRVAISPGNARVQVYAGERLLADSTRALLVDEAKHDQVFYLPRADVAMDQLEATEHTSYCPFKGHASYFSVRNSSDQGASTNLSNSVWSYQEPYDECAELSGYLAFYADRFKIRTAEV